MLNVPDIDNDIDDNDIDYDLDNENSINNDTDIGRTYTGGMNSRPV